MDFNPRSPRGERRNHKGDAFSTQDFNPRSPRGERPFPARAFATVLEFQSTLPSRGATFFRQLLRTVKSISIHAPLAGSDFLASRFFLISLIFQSTLPSRGATSSEDYKERFRAISIHAPLAGSDRETGLQTSRYRISIHAPLAGSDASFAPSEEVFFYFNPRSPRGERRGRKKRIRSIRNFNPRSPRGERLQRGGQNMKIN